MRDDLLAARHAVAQAGEEGDDLRFSMQFGETLLDGLVQELIDGGLGTFTNLLAIISDLLLAHAAHHAAQSGYQLIARSFELLGFSYNA
jgi:hypothetical protein